MRVESYIYHKNKKLNIDFTPNLAFLFFDNKSLVIECYDELKKINKNIKVVGVNGNRSINNSIPFVIKDGVSLLLFEFDDFFCSLYDVEDLDNTRKLFMSDYEKYNNSASIMFFPFEYDTNNFLDYIQDEKKMHNIYGGVYGNDDECFFNGEFIKHKLISVFFNQDKLEFFSIAIHGWKPIGPIFKVTKAHKNIVYELDNSPALDVVEEYIGEITQENIDNFLHPFCVDHNGYKSLASIKSINREEKYIEFYKYIYNGEKTTITIPDNQKTIIELIEKKISQVQCDGLFFFSCIGRFAYYQDLLEFEIEKVSSLLKVPFSGFLTYGEIGSNTINSKSILQNQTIDLVFFKEKEC